MRECRWWRRWEISDAFLSYGAPLFCIRHAVGTTYPGWLAARAILLCCVLAIASGETSAEERPEYLLEDMVVTATRLGQPYRDSPVNMTVISQSDIEHGTAKSLPELLGAQPGLFTRDFFATNGAGATVDLRGFGASGGQNTLILLDGKRLSDIDTSGIQWPALPVDAIERIEILRGGGAVLYGDGASAGVINVITKPTTKKGLQIHAGGMAESYGTREAHINADYTTGDVGWGIYANHYDSNGYRDNNRNLQSNIFGNFYGRFDTSTLVFKYNVDTQKTRLPGGRFVQPSAGLNELATDRRGTTSPLDSATRDGQNWNLIWSRDNDNTEMRVDIGNRQKKQTAYFDFGGFPDYRQTNLSVWSITPRIKFNRPVFDRENSLVVGVDRYEWDYGLEVSNASLNIGRPINDVSVEQKNSALYLQDSLQLSKMTMLSIGWRRERLQLQAEDRFDMGAPGGEFGSGATPTEAAQNESAYEFGVRHQLNQQFALTGKLGRSYRFVNADEIYEFSPTSSREFQLLRPQTANNKEAALEFSWSSGSARVSVFRMDVRDEIHLDAFTTGVGNTNLPPSRRDGVELETKWAAASSLELSGAYTYLRPRFLEGVLPGSGGTAINIVLSGRTVPLVPRNKLDLAMSWKMDESTRLNATVGYVSEQFMDNDEANNFGVKIPAYWFSNLKLIHQGHVWTTRISINNLLNRQYFNYAIKSQFSLDRYSAFALPERNVAVALEYAFK